jgi:hypothetical protein
MPKDCCRAIEHGAVEPLLLDYPAPEVGIYVVRPPGSYVSGKVEIMGALKLTVNQEKTRICRIPEEEFDFLGYSVLQRHKERRERRCRKAA